jgi:hypothetical protein
VVKVKGKGKGKVRFVSMVKKSKKDSLTATERFDAFLGFGAPSVFPAQTKELPIYADARNRHTGRRRGTEGREVLEGRERSSSSSSSFVAIGRTI